MKAIIIALLLVSALFIGCAQTNVSEQSAVQSSDVSEADVVSEVDKATIPETQEVEIGEMI